MKYRSAKFSCALLSLAVYRFSANINILLYKKSFEASVEVKFVSVTRTSFRDGLIIVPRRSSRIIIFFSRCVVSALGADYADIRWPIRANSANSPLMRGALRNTKGNIHTESSALA